MSEIRKRPPKLRSSRRAWLLIIAAVLAAHVAFFIFFKPQYLRFFETNVTGDDGDYSEFVLSDRPFVLINIPEEASSPPIPSEEAVSSQEKSADTLFIQDLGNPYLDLLPIERSGRKGDAGRRGLRKTTVEPKPLYIPWPKYPENMKEEAEGRVELLLFVDEMGEVREVKLYRGLPKDELNRIAIEAAQRIRFTPGIEKGVATAMWVRLTIGFQPR